MATHAKHATVPLIYKDRRGWMIVNILVLLNRAGMTFDNPYHCTLSLTLIHIMHGFTIAYLLRLQWPQVNAWTGYAVQHGRGRISKMSKVGANWIPRFILYCPSVTN